MQPTPEIEAFIARVNALPAGPGVSLDSVLQPSLDEETELRKLFATDRKNTRLSNPYVGLVDVFDAPDTIRTTRARVVEGPEDLSAKYVMPVSVEARRDEGEPSIVADLEEFKKNWAIFTEGSLSQLIDWNNVVAAGGSVLACLTPLNETDKVSKRAIRKFYHSSAYPTSDVDLFLWGLTPEQADLKIKTIYEAVRDSVPWDVTCIRTKHTVSIHSQYPYRSVQMVLRLYQSPAEILAGFDIDAPCCAYDGSRVWANPRAIVAMMRQCNTVDMSRRSPSYEVRLAKYSQRAFEVYVPTLDRSKIDPTIYERSIARMEGLARLLALEKLSNENMRSTFLEGRRQLRGRVYQNALSISKRRARILKGDLKAEKDSGVIEMNDYDVASLHIPYGPGWDARRIDKLIYQTDLGMNSTFNPKNKGRRLHRHPAFFGTIEECLEDCCGNCPKPIDDDERALQTEEDETYIRGRIQYIEENPGRQTMTGSFKPIDVGEWSEQVYIRPTQALFSAIAAHDRPAVQKLLGEENIDVNQRDHVGRTTLHVAIFAKAADIAVDLIDAGARITARLADGRTPLHLAAQFDLLVVVKKLFERNAKNVEEVEKKNPGEKDDDDDDDADAMDSQDAVERPSSEDDWSSHDDDDIDMVDADEADDEEEDDGDDDDDEEEDDGDDDDDDESPKSKKVNKATEAETATEDIEDEDDQPDIINVNESDWDFGFTPLSYSVLFGSIPTIDALFAGGADVKLESKPPSGSRLTRMHPLTLTILRDDEDEACKIAEHFLKNGASTATADEHMRTIFHIAVYAGKMKLVETLLRCDPNSAKVIDFPMLQGQNVVFPVVTAINKRHYGVVATLLAYDAKIDLDEQDITRAVEAAKPEVVRRMSMYGEVKNYLQLAYQPVEVALKNHDDLIKLLISLGATINFGPLQSLSRYSDTNHRRTIKEWVDRAIITIENTIVQQEEEELAVVDTPMAEPDVEKKEGWKGFHHEYYYSMKVDTPQSLDNAEIAKKQEERRKQDTRDRTEDIRDFLLEIQALLTEKGAKGWKEVYPSLETQASADFVGQNRQARRIKTVPYNTPGSLEETYVYISASNLYDRQNVPQHLTSAYDELYDACYAGDNDKIQRLCLPIEGQESGAPSPLNISVKMVDVSISRYDQNGYSPLFAAIVGRHWSTAKLILAIATAQYHPSDDKDEINFSLNVDLDDDSDDESCDSEESEMTIDQQDIKFVDIATRPSAVQCQVHPKTMLSEVTVRWFKKDVPEDYGPIGGTANLLAKAVADHDLDAFTHIANLYQTLAEPLKLGEAILSDILAHDQVDILDEYIRRTGEGVNVDVVKKEDGPKEAEEEVPVATNDANKIYLGLDVHGKKRMDLAAKNDPNASSDPNERGKTTPILWKAIRDNSKAIVKYFASDRPIEAYKAYATSFAHGDAKAIWLRRNLFGKNTSTADIRKKLSAWLGWKINSLGESPLIAALILGDLDLIKLLAELEPELVAQALKTKIKFVSLNVLLFAVRRSMTIGVVEYILEKGVSPVERDANRGWNIFHYMCDENNTYLLEFFLRKLPKEVTEELLKQQSKVRFNTPLHVAVKHGFVETTNLILRYSPSLASTLLQMRDVDGQTPLHCAVRRSSPGVTKNILEISNAIPSTSSQPLSTALLCTEDSVGLTPIEVVRLSALSDKINTQTNSDSVWFYSAQTVHIRPEPELDPRRVEVSPPADSSSDDTKNSEKPLEKGLRDLKDLITRWEGEGKEKIGRVDLKLLRFWVQEMEKRIENEKAKQKKIKDEEGAEKKERETRNPPKPITEERRAADHKGAEATDVHRTRRVIEDAVTSLSDGADNHRVLIHLLDVQRSVQATISKASSTGKDDEEEDQNSRDWRNRREQRRMQKHGAVGELEAEDEEEEEKKQRRMSLVFQYLSVGPDRL